MHDDPEDNAPLLPLSKQRFLQHNAVRRVLRHGTAASWVLRRPLSYLRWARRHPRAFALRLPVYLVALLLFVLVTTPLLFPSYSSPPKRYRELRSRCRGNHPGCANPRGEKVFIAVTLYDPDGSVAGGRWGKAVESLVHILGPENVFLSIYENDSGEKGDRALDRLNAGVPSPKRIISDLKKPDYDAFPHATMPDGTRVLKRLSYLSTVRNRAFEPLDRFTEETMVYDKVLFLSDALFKPLDAAQLLFNTNADANGTTHYLSACALDYNQSPFLLYDLYAQRDSAGYSNGLPLFPYFSPAGDAVSRTAMLEERDAVPVRSCWGGMVAAQAAPFQNRGEALPHPDWREPGHHVVDPANPRKVSAPVRFRFEPEVFYDACECCLLQADLSAVASPGGQSGVYVNPYVRVAYSQRVLDLLPYARRLERLLPPIQRLIGRLASLPTKNPHRTVQQGEVFKEEVYGKSGWEVVERKGRSGMFCGVREMQTIVGGGRKEGERGEGPVNWVNWKIPQGQAFDFPT